METAVACYLITDEIGFLERFLHTSQFHLSHHQSGIVAIELIHLKGMYAIGTFHQIACLIDDSRLTKLKQLFRLIQRDFFLELIPLDARRIRRSFDGKVATAIA